MLYNNDSQGTFLAMTGRVVEHDVARELQVEVWREVRGAFDARRVEEGLTQSELARRMGLQRERVHYWMSRPDRMTLAAAARLMAGMGGRLGCRSRLMKAAGALEVAE